MLGDIDLDLIPNYVTQGTAARQRKRLSNIKGLALHNSHEGVLEAGSYTARVRIDSVIVSNPRRSWPPSRLDTTGDSQPESSK